MHRELDAPGVDFRPEGRLRVSGPSGLILRSVVWSRVQVVQGSGGPGFRWSRVQDSRGT